MNLQPTSDSLLTQNEQFEQNDSAHKQQPTPKNPTPKKFNGFLVSKNKSVLEYSEFHNGMYHLTISEKFGLELICNVQKEKKTEKVTKSHNLPILVFVCKMTLEQL